MCFFNLHLKEVKELDSARLFQIMQDHKRKGPMSLVLALMVSDDLEDIMC